MADLRAAALAWHDAGYTVIPAAVDGTKRPAFDWKTYETTRPERTQVDAWMASGTYDGFGLVCGGATGVELFELEGRALTEGCQATLVAALERDKLTPVWQRLMGGYTEWTPGGGIHVLYRVLDGDAPAARGNTKLARRPSTPDELAANPKAKVQVLAETRGEGGYVIVAPSGGRTHETGASWVRHHGGPATVPTLTPDERDALYALTSLVLDQMPHPELDGPPRPAQSPTGAVLAGGELRPGDDYNARATWDELLTPAGWTKVRAMGDGYAWRRPGKDRGMSATTGQSRDGADRLYVFSTSTEFDTERPYSKFAAYALMHHGGRYDDASAALRRAGYGGERTEPALTFEGRAPTQGTADPPVAGQAPALTPASTIQAGSFDDLVATELLRLRARREATRRLDAEEAAAAFREPPSRFTLTDELALPDDEVTYVIDQAQPAGSNVLLVAQYKTGKTTLLGSLVWSLADGKPFLGQFPVDTDKRIAVFNYELSEGQYRRWLRDLGIGNTDQVAVLNLRGYRMPVTVPSFEDWVVEWLASRNVGYWALDPFSRAFTGSGNENSNSEVGVFLDTLDVIKERAGIRDLLLVTHTGRGVFEDGDERARGATRLDDWADARWLLTADDQGTRYFRADGRDVDVPQSSLAYDPLTRLLTLSGGDKASAQRARVEAAALEIITNRPGTIQADLRAGVRSIVGRASNDMIANAVAALQARHAIRAEHGRYNRLHYYLSSHTPASDMS